MSSRKIRRVLILVAVFALAVSTASNFAARSSTAECVQACNDDRIPCTGECKADEDLCQDDCLELPLEAQADCNDACSAAFFACNSICVDLSKECKAACPRGQTESPSEPLP